MRKIETINQAFLIVLCVFCAIVFALCNNTTASAATEAKTGYTSALADLQADESFNAEAFPAVENDYALYLLQIAESTGGELLVYVYQPCAESKRLLATSINISTGINENLSYKNYKLVFLNSDGVFFKYLVKGFTVKSDKVRYYDISGIYRAWNENIDEDLPETNENVIAEVVFGVEKQYTACTVDGNVSYSVLECEYIELKNKYVGYLRYGWDEMPAFLKFYTAGMFDVQSTVDSWFCAFSTDFPIDKLMEADVYYLRQDVYYAALGIIGFATPKTEKYRYLKHKDRQTVEAGLFHKNTYSWDLIQSVEEFKATENLTDECKERLKDEQWVLRFTETEYKNAYTLVESVSYMASGSRISNVTVLRLKFETDGKVYNMGVVDNKQSPGEGQAPDNNYKPEKPDDELTWWEKIVKFFKDAWAAIKKFFSFKLPWWVYVAVVGVVLAIVLPILGLIFPPIMTVLKLILKGLWFGIKYLFKALWWLICLPFRGIAALVRKYKKNKKDKPAQYKQDKQIRF